jgi:hypothetical protein
MSQVEELIWNEARSGQIAEPMKVNLAYQQE